MSVMSSPNDDGPAPSSERTNRGPYRSGNDIGGRYELVRMIGRGGIGQVWLAKDRALDAQVAIKLFLRDGPDDDGAERLVEEARAAAQLAHPAIVRVFDVGETADGDPFLVMELLSGESFEDLIRRQGPLRATRAVAILLPIIEALGAAHAQGITHRDIKPANLFLGRVASGTPGHATVQPKVIDFGIAKRADSVSRLTAAGTLVGSPPYMSPEQVRSRSVDGRSDIWSVCIVLYELLTARLPFPMSSHYELFRAVVTRPPAPITEDIDPALAAILFRGLSKSTDTRWSTMRDLGVALARWLVTQGVREDATGTSLQTAWISGPTILSSIPPAPSGRVYAADIPTVEGNADEGFPGTTSDRVPRPDLGSTESGLMAVVRRHRAAGFAVGGALSIALVVATGLGVGRGLEARLGPRAPRSAAARRNELAMAPAPTVRELPRRSEPLPSNHVPPRTAPVPLASATTTDAPPSKAPPSAASSKPRASGEFGF